MKRSSVIPFPRHEQKASTYCSACLSLLFICTIPDVLHQRGPRNSPYSAVSIALELTGI